jgi:signal transduction histidine kinase/HAMP domain-containing protein
MKIGHKLTFGFVGLALLIAVFGYVCFQTSQTALEESIGKNASDLSEQILDKISRNISHRIEETQAYATDELAKEYITLSNAQFENTSDPNSYIAQTDRDWANGADLPIIKELTNNELAKELQERQKFYQNKYGYNLLGEIFVTNRFGVNVAQTNRTTDYYQADEEWWQAAHKYGLFVGNVNYDESSGTFSTEIAAKIDDANGNFAGVIKVVPNIKETINMLNAAKLAAEYKTLQLHLIDHSGKIIYSTKDYKFGQNAVSPFASCFSNAGFHKQKLYMTSKAGQLFTMTPAKKSESFRGLGWTLATETNTAEIFAPMIDLRNTMLLAGVVIMGLAFLASSITYRSVVVPIAELQKATIQIASGNLDTHLTKAGSGEISQLANSFQRMAQRLKKTIDDLNDEVNGRKLTEQKFSKSEQFLNNIFNSIQDGIGIIDKDMNIIMVNPWLESRHVGKAPLVGKKCYNVYENRDSICPQCPCAETFKTGTSLSVVIPAASSNHHNEWISVTSFPLKDHHGNITGVIEYIRDITKYKKAEEVLNGKAEQIMKHHNTLMKLANIPDYDINSLLGLITEQDAQVLNVAQVSVWFYNTERTEIICRDLFIKDQNKHEKDMSLKVQDYPRYFKTMENTRVLAANNAWTDSCTSEFTETYLKPKGITSMLDIPIRLHGIIIGVLCHEHTGPARGWSDSEQDFAASVADMISLKLEASERAKAEQELDHINKKLETAVRELNISNRQLHDFVHVAAHDLKTPVRGIGTLADWIISDYGDKLDGLGREQVRLLKARVIRIDKLIDGMLQFSKIVRTKHKERQVNLNDILSDIKGTILQSGNIDIAVDSMPSITCEHDHIELVFESLIANAVTFMDKTKGQVKVGCVEQGDFWKFYVNDNGPGIEQKYFEKIFRIFQTLPKNDEPETAGIGLAIVKKIVELYGGKIWVESLPGSGSTFYFTFPRTIEDTLYAATKTNTAC